MRNIILRRILLYIIAFIICFLFALNSAKSIDHAYEVFYHNLNSIMQKYNYTDNYDSYYDLKFSNESNVFKYELQKEEDETIVEDLIAEIHLDYTDDIHATLDFLNEVYDKEDLKLYENEIQKLIKTYQTTAEEEMFQEYDTRRQVVIRIEDSDVKDFKLSYSVNVFRLHIRNN